jgi:hypothetical protein
MVVSWACSYLIAYRSLPPITTHGLQLFCSLATLPPSLIHIPNFFHPGPRHNHCITFPIAQPITTHHQLSPHMTSNCSVAPFPWPQSLIHISEPYHLGLQPFHGVPHSPLPPITTRGLKLFCSLATLPQSLLHIPKFFRSGPQPLYHNPHSPSPPITTHYHPLPTITNHHHA